MDLSGRYEIPAPPERVWDAINDPEVLKACIPGCESLTKTDASHFEASAKLKIGPVSATFKGNVALDELDPPRRCVMRGEGQGGVAGFARGEAEVLLEAIEGGTALTYSAKANVGGKLAQIGQRLIAGAAKQIADDFFARFAAQLAPAAAAPDTALEQALVEAEAITIAESHAEGMTMEQIALEPASAPQAAPVTASRPAAPPRDGAAAEVWVVGLVAVIIILLILLGLVL